MHQLVTSRDQLPVPNDFDFGTALQCCPFARQFAGYRLHRLMIVPNFVFTFQFFISLGIICTEGKKNDNNGIFTTKGIFKIKK